MSHGACVGIADAQAIGPRLGDCVFGRVDRDECLGRGHREVIDAIASGRADFLPIRSDVRPILFGVDKFANVVIEIIAGIAVAIKPRYAAYIVAAWLAGIIVNLLTYSGYYDVALRDFGLLLAALTLARLASKYDSPWLGESSSK